MRTITLNVPQGVGDIVWIYRKFSPYYEKINFNILTTNTACPVQSRSLPFLKIMTKVGEAKMLATTLDHYQQVATTKYSQIDIMDRNRGQAMDYACNKPLEEGIRLEEIDPGLLVDWDAPIVSHFASMPWKDYLCLYVCGTHKSGNVWSVDQWCDFTNLFCKKLKLDYPIAVVGARFDEPTVSQVSATLRARGLKSAPFVDPYPANLCYVLHNALAFIGYQSGLSILADHFDTPQVMLYFNQLENLRYSWPKPRNLNSRAYRPFFFKETPQQVVEQLGDFQVKKPGRQVLLTCGIGDFLAIESLLTDEERQTVDHFFYATRQEAAIRELIATQPELFPNLKYQVTLYRNFGAPDTKNFCITDKAQLQRMPLLLHGVQLNHIEDWGIQMLGDEFSSGKRKMNRSWFVEHAAKSTIALPEKYVAIHPYSQNARKDFRDLSAGDWEAILKWLERTGLTGVVVNQGPEAAPKHPQLIDLTNKTTLDEAIRIVTGARAYVGGSSCFSVVAAKVLPENRLFVKGHHTLKDRWHKVYYAPHTSGQFIYQDLGFLALHGPAL